ncbi:Macrophage colony-stimulating factor 1 receptor [Paecilomyces lecythidis]
MANHLTAEPLTPGPTFNWFFLVELIVSGVLSLFFLFYFNRLFATLVSYGIRAYTWHYYRAYIDIHALQISLLGGRIFFKGITYHGVNETVLVHGGYVTWNYWKRKVKQLGLSKEEEFGSSSPEDVQGDDSGSQNASREKGSVKGDDHLPCRIGVTLYGLEWFLYNRTPAYDTILEGFGHNPEQQSPNNGEALFPSVSGQSSSYQSTSQGAMKDGLAGKRTYTNSSSPTSPSMGATSPKDSFRPTRNDTGFSTTRDAPDDHQSDASSSILLQLLPLRIKCTKGAIVVGNENTRTVLTTTFAKANGTIDATDAGPLDLYRQIFALEMDHPVVQMRPNPDYKQTQLSAAKGIGALKEEGPGISRKPTFHFNYQLRKQRMWHSIRDLVPYFQKSVESFHIGHSGKATASSANKSGLRDESRWIGLTRYLDDDYQDEHEGWNDIEYGRFSTILDCPHLSVTYYWDIPGQVSSEHASLPYVNTPGDINGADPPKWGLDVKVNGGMINYGPWADRERVGLQNVFFPNPYRSSEPEKPLNPGETRRSTSFKLLIEVDEETTLRIPTREPSKDWQWKGRADAIKDAARLKKQKQKRTTRTNEGDKGNAGPDIRPFGWLSLRLARDSTITYTMDMVASRTGYRNHINLDLRETKLSTSVNHGLLWQCPRQIVSCDLSNPLIWNSPRKWDFNVESYDLELFLLRDHIFLITDLVTDWTTGPPADYYTFVPFTYNINLTFTDFKLFVNVNDSNIISNPSDLEDNTFVVIKGKRLAADVGIPMTKFRPDLNAVLFNVSLHKGAIDVVTPVWNTLHTFLTNKSVAALESLAIDGSYTYYLSTSPALTDTLVLNIAGLNPKLYLYGFLMRYFIKIKDNYFGEEMHFKTLEEFQEAANSESPAEHHGLNPGRKSNDLDVIIHVSVDNACALLPVNIYDRRNSIRLTTASIEADMRFTNYYMDLETSISPLEAALETITFGTSTEVSNTQIFIDGLSIYGHRLFGLPPAEPTYVCNWDFRLGDVAGECSVEFLRHMVTAIRNFDFSLDDKENALPELVPVALHDVTFLRATIDSLHLSVIVDATALMLRTGTVTVQFNDWADFMFSKRLNVGIPNLTVAAVDRRSAARYQGRHYESVLTHALFRTDITLKMAQRKSNFDEDRRLQQEHIRVHDQRTNRTPWLLFDLEAADTGSSHPNANRVDPPAMPVPFMPDPVPNMDSVMDTLSSRGPSIFRRNLNRKSSFLSESFSLHTTRYATGRSSRLASDAQSSMLSSRGSVFHDDSSRNTRVQQSTHMMDGTSDHYGDTAGKDVHSGIGGLSSTWAMPHFALHYVEPDTSNLPSLPSDLRGWNADAINYGTTTGSASLEDNSGTQVNFFCELSTGLTGFCAPEFLHVVSSVVEGMQPNHPVDVLDSLQMDVMTDIANQDKLIDKPRTTTSISIRVPLTRLRLLNSASSDPSGQIRFHDEYNVEISRLTTAFRTKVERRKDDLHEGIQQSLVVHASTDSLSFGVEGRRTDTPHGKAEFNCTTKDMNFWLGVAPDIRSHLQMRTIETATSSKSVEQLAFLVKRTTTMFDSVASSFQHASYIGASRLRSLIYSLSQMAPDMPDPLFLTRPSYVLRVARTHLRLHDSWKIISRVRAIYQNLSEDRRRELLGTCTDTKPKLPENARETVLSIFDEWRTWDLAHVEKSHIMRKVWSPSVVTNEPSTSQPLNLSVAVRRFRFSVDPGPKESGITVEHLSTALAIDPRSGENASASRRPKTAIVLRSYCSSASLQLRWEILDLVEVVTKTMSNVTLESATPPGASDDNPSGPLEVHVVLGADLGTITIEGINLRIALIGQALKGSFVGETEKGNMSDELSVLLAAEATSAEISDRFKLLMLARVWDPTVYLSYVLQEKESLLEHDWKVAGSCKRLRFDVKEDPLGMVKAADRVVEDEVRYVRELMRNIEVPKAQPAPVSPDTKSSHHRFQAATFLDDYRITFSLLPSLTYMIAGEVARMSVVPRRDAKLEVDFDVKSNSHVFQSLEGSTWHTVSALRIPPINGRVLVKLAPVTTLEADVTIELIRLQASAVRSLLSAVNGPEISHLVSDFKDSVDTLRVRLDNVLDLEKPKTQVKAPSESSDILYKVRLTMAGMSIHASAPGLKSKQYSADMEFSFGMVQMRLDNGLDQGKPLDLPEFHVNVSQISLDIRRTNDFNSHSYGHFVLDIGVLGTSRINETGQLVRAYYLTSKGFEVGLCAVTASLVVDIAAHLQERIKTLDMSHEVKRLKKLRHRTHSEAKPKAAEVPSIEVQDEMGSESLFNAMYSVELFNMQVSWIMADSQPSSPGREPEDLVFSIRRAALSTQKQNAAKLRIEDMQLQMVPQSHDRKKRTLNSALMPEIVFNVAYLSTKNDIRLAFQAAGKSLDIRATSEFILPASLLQHSIASASEELREANAIWATAPSPVDDKERGLFGNKRLASFLIDVDFAGAIVTLQGKRMDYQQTKLTAALKGTRPPEGRFGQYVQGDPATTASLRTPGVALKVQFEDNGTDDPTLNAELKVDPSTNVLYPTVVPLVKQISASIKEVVGEQDSGTQESTSKLQAQKLMPDTSLSANDPDTILGRCKLNVGMWICKQEFSLSCQPIARVAATAQFESIYMTVNTVQSAEQRRFFAILVAFNSLQASVKHVYSHESTASFEVDKMVMSLMNSKHVSATNGISAILKVSPLKTLVNVKQLQDFLLFREIWVPSSDDQPGPESREPPRSPSSDSQPYMVQRYQQVASAGAFPWNSALAVEELEIQLDLGQTVGKSQFSIKDLWLSSKKNSDWEQNLCVGFRTMAIESKGRMSGLVELADLKVRTSIKFPGDSAVLGQTPLIQASVAFDSLQAKVSFEYQPFLVADISMFEFLMYNVRNTSGPQQDRLVSILEGEKVQVFCTTLTASQSVGLFQAWQRLAQDKQAAYEASLKEIERYLRRKSSVVSEKMNLRPDDAARRKEESEKAPISLHTDVVVSIRAVNVGAFPSTFIDSQVFKMEALDTQARFAVALEDERIHSALGLTLGQLRVALSNVNRPGTPTHSSDELSVDDVANRATGSRGGTILKVPRVVASMETWQRPGKNEIEYIFKSAFEGKVDVGWNYSRISFIRGMWMNHSRALASRLGKPLPPSAVRITGGPRPEGAAGEFDEQEKITAVVNMPQSRYAYQALEPPVIETPQLRDMGEATPPLEWIGLHRDKLPNVTHQIIIVTLLEIAKEVEDAYSKILGSS